MPVQMVCDSTSLVSAALRDSLTSASSSSSGSGIGGGSSVSGSSSSCGGSKGGVSSSSFYGSASTSNNGPGGYQEQDDEEFGRMENDLMLALKRNQLRPIRYEEVPNDCNELDNLKSKYTVLKTTASSGSNGINGSNSISGVGPVVNGSTTNTSALLMNGGNHLLPSTTTTTKSAAADITRNGPTGGGGQKHDGSSASSGGKDQLPTPKRVLFARENVQIGWKATGRKWNTGAGMINVGNTCYLNSTLQALFHVPAIANWLISDGPHRERCDDNNGQGCIICAMAKTLLASQNNQGAIKPYLVYSKLRLVCKHLVPGRQEDAHEFLRYLMEAMEKSYLSRFKNSKDLDQYSKETTPLNQILGGYLRSEVKCLSCQHVSTTFQHFEDLLLDIRKASSIEEALQVYFARERLEEMQYKCEACKKKVAATKQFSLERAPYALCIQLKRFSMMGGKINKHVELRSRLDLTPYASKSAGGGKLTYRLASMVTHLGNTQHCGHYTAIGGTESGSYYVFDDSSVRPISMQHVTSTNAYIIFYEMESVQNGIKPNASSTATLASFANTTTGSSSGKVGSSGEAGNTTTSRTSTNPPPFRVHGSGNNPLLPSKLDNRSGFIGPVLPQSSPEKAKKLVNGLSHHLYGDDDEGEPMVTSTSSRLSPVSSTTSSLSNPSPVKQSGSSNSLNSPSGTKLIKNPLSQSPSSSMKNKFGMTVSSNGLASPSGSSSNPGSFKSSFTQPTSSTSALPSMPKLCNSPAAAKNCAEPLSTTSSASNSTTKGAGFPGSSVSSKNTANGHISSSNNNNGSPSKTVRLVAYDADDDDDEDEDEDECDDQRTKRCNGRDPQEDNDDSDEDIDRMQSHVLLGPGSKKHQQQQQQRSTEDDSYSPKSPPVIKTKAGLWKVSDNRHQSSSSSSSSSGGSAASSNNASPATSGNSSPANYNGGHSMNGNGGPLASGYQTNNNRNQYNNGFNSYNHSNGNINSNGNNSRNGNGNDVVSQLQQYSHRGYGAPVRSWNGQQTTMERELANERREDRKRQLEDDRDTEMDRGRTKKVKTHQYHQQQQQQRNSGNPFQMHQSHQMMNGGNNGIRKWNNNNNNNGFGGGGKYHFQNRGGNNYYQNGNHPRSHNGFRNGGGGGRHGRNGFYNKSHHYHHQRDKF